MIGIQMGSESDGQADKIAALEAENKALAVKHGWELGALSLLLAQKDEAIAKVKESLSHRGYGWEEEFAILAAALSASHPSVEHAKNLLAVVEAAKSYIRIADNGDSRGTDVRFALGVLRAHLDALSRLGAVK